MEKVLYEELLPGEFTERVRKMPAAYLPLGTLEWHGPHMPLGADGIQSRELFVRVAEKAGGVVLPMLFMGPDRAFYDGENAFYGMDINTAGALRTYCVQQMEGSAYWQSRELFQGYLRRYGLGDWARDRYSSLAAKAGDCVECGACEERCPYHLPIREMLKSAAKDFGA